MQDKDKDKDKNNTDDNYNIELVEPSKKNINIIGLNNRYHIKKLIADKNEKKKIRKETVDWNFSSVIYESEKQTGLITQLYENCIIGVAEKKTLSTECALTYRQLEKKIQGYKQQDIEKKRFTPENFITIDNVITELYNSNLNCYYCKTNVFLLYEHVREARQWTVDRINNDEGHNKDNILISCLACNLKRRRTGKDAFLFTKQLQIIKG